MPEHVLVVGGGMDMPSRLRATAPEVRTSIICQLAALPKLQEQTGHQRVLALPADAPMRDWIDLAQYVHTMDPFTRIATLGERDQDRAAAIDESLRLPMHSPATIRSVHHKPTMRQRLADLDVDDTPFQVVHDEVELRRFVRTYGVPCIAKPAIGAGSVGIARIDHENDISAAFARADIVNEWSSGGVLVERMHLGPQYSVEALSEDGRHRIIAVTKKYYDPLTLVEIGHVCPAPLENRDVAVIESYVTAVLNALGVRFGPTHTEIVLTDAGPRVIETHTRAAGDEIPSLVRDAIGVDMQRLIVQQVLGYPILEELERALAMPRERRHDAIWYAATRSSGTLESVGGVDAVASRAHIIEVRQLHAPGDPIDELTWSGSRVAFVRAYGATAEEAVARARDGVASLTISVRAPLLDPAAIRCQLGVALEEAQ